MKKPNLVLQTDFGLTTGFVSSMYGVIKMIDDSLNIYDLNHEIRPFDMKQASYLLADTIPYWAPGTVFVSVVDPGVGTSRRNCVAKLKNGSFVVTPDNGTLTAVFEQIEEVRQIDESVNRLPGSAKSGTFHGRDVYAYCGGRLAAGAIDFKDVGPAYPVSECVIFPAPSCAVSDGLAEGVIAGCLKHFGGLSSSISVENFEKTGIALGETTHVTIKKGGNVLFDQDVLYHRSFGYVGVGEPILYNGSTTPYISLSLNQRSFTDKYLPHIFDIGEDFSDYKITIRKKEEGAKAAK